MESTDFEQLTESLRQASKIRRCKLKASRVTAFSPLDIRAIRHELGKSQAQFAQMIGVSVSTLQNWEQRRRIPEGPARTPLCVAAASSYVVAAALANDVVAKP